MLAISYVDGKITYIKVVSCKNNNPRELIENYKNGEFTYEYKLNDNFVSNLIFD